MTMACLGLCWTFQMKNPMSQAPAHNLSSAETKSVTEQRERAMALGWAKQTSVLWLDISSFQALQLNFLKVIVQRHKPAPPLKWLGHSCVVWYGARASSSLGEISEGRCGGVAGLEDGNPAALPSWGWISKRKRQSLLKALLLCCPGRRKWVESILPALQALFPYSDLVASHAGKAYLPCLKDDRRKFQWFTQLDRGHTAQRNKHSSLAQIYTTFKSEVLFP